MGVIPGDGLFVHSSMRAIGPMVGGAQCIVRTMLDVIGDDGLLAMPGFSSDAYFHSHFDPARLSATEITEVERAVPGFDPRLSPASSMGVIAETFRTWPGTLRSGHPTTSICLNGRDADSYAAPHPLAWATGPETPLGRLRGRDRMKLLLVGVGWSRCTALHTAETLASHRRTKVRRFKTGPNDAKWIETLDVADDIGRLFPVVGAAFKASGQVHTARLGEAECYICDFGDLVSFATEWIDDANAMSGDQA